MKAEVGIVACLSAVDDLLWDPYINHGRFHAVHNACHYTLIFFFYIHLLLLLCIVHACFSGLLAAFSLEQASNRTEE